MLPIIDVTPNIAFQGLSMYLPTTLERQMTAVRYASQNHTHLLCLHQNGEYKQNPGIGDWMSFGITSKIELMQDTGSLIRLRLIGVSRFRVNQIRKDGAFFQGQGSILPEPSLDISVFKKVRLNLTSNLERAFRAQNADFSVALRGILNMQAIDDVNPTVFISRFLNEMNRMTHARAEVLKIMQLSDASEMLRRVEAFYQNSKHVDFMIRCFAAE